MNNQSQNINSSTGLTLPWIIGIVLITTASIGYLLYRTIQKRKKGMVLTHSKRSGKSGSIRQSSGFACISSSYPLQVGTCHKDIKILQEYLLKKGSRLGNTGRKRNGVDGQFGEKTRKAAFQHLAKTSFSEQDIKQLQT